MNKILKITLYLLLCICVIGILLSFILHIEHVEYGFANPGINFNSIEIIKLILVICYILSIICLCIKLRKNVLSIVPYIIITSLIIIRFILVQNVLISYLY